MGDLDGSAIRLPGNGKRGTGVPPDTGGGWVNGRSDDSIYVKGYAHMVHFHELRMVETEPHDELVNNGAFCLAETGGCMCLFASWWRLFLRLEPGVRGKVVHPRNGEYSSAGLPRARHGIHPCI